MLPQIAPGLRGQGPTAGDGMNLRAYWVAEKPQAASRRWLIRLAAASGLFVAACAGGGPPPSGSGSLFGDQPGASPFGQQMAGVPGGVKVGVILSLSAQGNAGNAAQSMKNAADLALTEFQGANIQLIFKDDGGTAVGAQNAAQQLLSEGAEIILGPLLSHAVAAAGQTTRNRGVPLIGFSTDSNVAARGVYLLSFLPETEVDRVVSFAASQGRKSFISVLPDSAYGAVVEGSFKQAVAARGGRVVALEHYPNDPNRIGEAARKVASSARQADAVFIADAPETTPLVIQQMRANGMAAGRMQIMGTWLWDDPKLFGDPNMNGAWFAAPDVSGFRAFAQRFRSRFGQDPLRTSSLAYDAVSLVAALVKTQGPNRFSEEVLTNPSGFSGIDGVFRFRSDGTSERGLAIMEIRNGSARVISPAPRSFGQQAAPAASL
jgi:branched-chain amino acid transport system substrate-binding protein